MNTIEKKLADGLKEAGKKNLALSSVVPKISDDVQRDMSMENVAKPIAEAIFDGEARVFRVSVNDVNSMQDVCADILYILDDSGIIGGNPPLSVNAGDVVVFNGLSWQKIGGGGAGPAIDAYTKSETDNRISEGILAHNALSDSHADIRHSITAEATARANADTDLGTHIDEEASDRQQADSELQAQIDAISSKSDVVDVVASYAELEAYDTSALGDNDVVKVLEDETHDNAESYYRWHVVTQTWGYIGSQGPFVTPAEMQTALGGKVDKVTGKGLSTNDFTDAAKAVTDNIFLATYNSTSYADIKAAYDAGKTVLCRFTDSNHTLRVATFDRLVNSTTSTSYAYFASVTKSDAYELVASKTRYGTTTSWSSTSKSWGSLAEKDSVTNADISGTIQDAHIASAATWNGKQDAISDLSTIISNASNGQTAYGWGNHATWTPSFSQASSRTNLNGSGETIATILGKVKKWFADLGSDSLAWISKNTSGSDSKVLSQKGNWVNLPSIPSVPTALSDLSDDSTHRLVTDTEKSTWNGKQDAINDLSTIISNASNGQTSYGWGNHATWTPSFSQASSRTNLNGSGETIATILGKVKKWFADLGSDSLAWISKNTSGSDSKVLSQKGNWVNLPSSGMSTDANNASDAAIRNLINKITRVSTNIDGNEYFVTVASDGQWKYKMSSLKSWCTDGLADNSEVMHKAGSETITGEKTLSRGSGQNTYWRCQRTDTGNNIQFGIGSGGVNRGIYDEKTIGGWLLRLDDDGKVLLGDNSSKEGSVFLKLPTYASNYNISSGIWANNNPGTDVGDIQFGCFCYYGGTKRYGVQLDADRSSGQYGIWCYPTSAVSKWLCYMESDGVAHLGGNTDAQVQLGNRVFDFSGTFSASSNTIYFI